MDFKSERELILDVLQKAYVHSVPTNELITGCYANDFAGPAHWSRALDFPREAGESPFSGLRYIDFKDCTNVFALRYSDGEAVNVYSLGTSDLRKLAGVLRASIALRKQPRLNRGGLTRQQRAKAMYKKLSGSNGKGRGVSK